MKSQRSTAGTCAGGTDFMARVLGLLLFLLGVAMLCVTFQVAYDLFNQLSASSHAWVGSSTNPKSEPTGMQVGIAFAGVLLKITVLIAMGFLASLISSKGSQMYASASARRDGTVSGERDAKDGRAAE